MDLVLSNNSSSQLLLKARFLLRIGMEIPSLVHMLPLEENVVGACPEASVVSSLVMSGIQLLEESRANVRIAERRIPRFGDEDSTTS
jgi:hypothetical protein